jgi:hypothetical protein
MKGGKRKAFKKLRGCLPRTSPNKEEAKSEDDAVLFYLCRFIIF